MCAELGISPSAFRGRPRVVAYEYDDQGRILRTRERSPWTPEDRALMIARLLHKRGDCPGCGQPKEKAWHPENDGHLEVTGVYECFGCYALDLADWDGNEAQRPKPKRYPILEYTRDEKTNPLGPMPAPTRREGVTHGA